MSEPVSPVKKVAWQLDAAQWLQQQQCWSGDAHSRIVLEPPKAGRFLALSACIRVLDEPAALRLYVETAIDVQVFPLPSSLQGNVAEVFALASPARRIWIQPLQASGRFELSTLQCKGIPYWQYRWRQLRRVALFLWRTPKALRQQAGIDWLHACSQPAETYRRVGQLRACAPAMPYAEWQQRFEHLTAHQLRMIERRLPELLAKHRLLVLVLAQPGVDEDDWQRSLLSIEQSLGLSAAALSKLHCVLLSDDLTVEPGCRLPRQLATMAQLQQQLAELPASQPVLLLPAGVALAPVALCWWLEALDGSAASWCYSDHDYLDQQGERIEPQFKPDWSLELARSSHYTGDTLLVQSKALLATGWLQPERSGTELRVTERLPITELFPVTQLKVQQLVLQLSAQLPEPPLHIPAVLWHQPIAQRQLPSATILQQQLQRQGIAARVETNAHGLLDLHYPLPNPAPLVSVVIPTRDMLHLLKPCVDSLLHRTDYPAIEVLIVDNQSTEPETQAYFDGLTQEPRVRVLRYDHPFNYSAINNFAVEQAKGSLICLLNNDTEVIRPDWLTQMVAQLSQPGVGIVGARLLFADQRVQHAGDVIGVGGCATHLHFRLPADASGYMGRAVVSQDLSAVTAACLLTPKALYLELGGLNETELTVAFNDVDYCLKVREAGWRVLYTPLALLYHYESVSRGKDDNPAKKQRAAKEAAYMRARWAKQMQGDPFYNPNLNGTAADFRVSAAPRVRKPWPQ